MNNKLVRRCVVLNGEQLLLEFQSGELKIYSVKTLMSKLQAAKDLKDIELLKKAQVIGNGEAILWEDTEKGIEIDVSHTEFYNNGVNVWEYKFGKDARHA